MKLSHNGSESKLFRFICIFSGKCRFSDNFGPKMGVRRYREYLESIEMWSSMIGKAQPVHQIVQDNSESKLFTFICVFLGKCRFSDNFGTKIGVRRRKNYFICHENWTSHTRDHKFSKEGNQSYLLTTLTLKVLLRMVLILLFIRFIAIFRQKS